MANDRFDMDLLEVVFYSWKLHVERKRVLRSVQRKYIHAANLYRAKSCFLALAVYSQEKAQKSALHRRLETARRLHRTKKVFRAWRLYAKTHKCRETTLRTALSNRALKRSAKVFALWRDYAKTYYSQWVSELTVTQLQHLKKLSFFWSLHLFKLFAGACQKAVREREMEARGVGFYYERLRLKALLSIRLSLQRRLERESQLVATYEHYKQTLQSKAFSALAEHAFMSYTKKLVFDCWKATAREHSVLRKYLKECGVELLWPARRDSKPAGNNSSFSSEVGYELTIE